MPGSSRSWLAFNDLNGVPASGNEFLMKQVLRNEWNFDGLVVSDWDSIHQLSVHGFTRDDKDAAFEAANAGVDMEMASRTYSNHIPALIEEGRIDQQTVDNMVYNILLVKLRLGLFEDPYTHPSRLPQLLNEERLQAARESARQSCVLLKNNHCTLPLSPDQLSSLAVIGPLADDPYEQLGHLGIRRRLKGQPDLPAGHSGAGWRQYGYSLVARL